MEFIAFMLTMPLRGDVIVGGVLLSAHCYFGMTCGGRKYHHFRTNLDIIVRFVHHQQISHQ